MKSETSGGYSPLMKFTGKPLDTVTGLQYNRHRWYDPALGRWTSEDPIGFASGDANLVRYLANQPTGRQDSLGLFADRIEVRSYKVVATTDKTTW